MKMIDNSDELFILDNTLKNYGLFLSEHSSNLKQIESLIQESCLKERLRTKHNIIYIELHPCENTSLQELSCTNSKLFNKTIIIFSTILKEIDLLKIESNSYLKSFLVLDEQEYENSIVKGKQYSEFGQLLLLLQKLVSFVQRCYYVVKNTFQQIDLYYKNEKSIFAELHGFNFKIVYEQIGDLLQELIKIDLLLENQTHFKKVLKNYKRLIQNEKFMEENFMHNKAKVVYLEKVLSSIEGLFQGNLFENCLKNSFDQSFLSSTTKISDDLNSIIREIWFSLEPTLGEHSNVVDKNKFVSLLCLHIVSFKIVKDIDKKVFRYLWDANKKLPCVCYQNNIVLFPCDLLLKHLPSQMKSLNNKNAVQTINNNQNAFLYGQLQSLYSFQQNMYLQVGSWLFKLEACLSLKGDVTSSDSFVNKSKLFEQGLSYAGTIKYFLVSLLSLQVHLKKAFTKADVLLICSLIKLLKILKRTFERNNLLYLELQAQVVQYYSIVVLNILSQIKKNLRKNNSKTAFQIEAIVLTENCIAGTYSNERNFIKKIVIGYLYKQKLFKEAEYNSLMEYLTEISILMDFNTLLFDYCDCSFLYYYKALFPVFISGKNNFNADLSTIQLTFDTLNDCKHVMNNLIDENIKEHQLFAFENEIKKLVQKNFLDILCQKLETDLRLNVHIHLNPESRNVSSLELTQFSSFSYLPQFNFLDHHYNLKALVEHQLNKSFYTLTTVALHNWKIYSEMKIWAEQKYSFTFLEPHLPSQTLDQGIDLLQIMRNINLFVSKFLYNLNNQIFVEESSNNKHLNTLSIKHVANSIRTHGSGIMNTTVNYTYQFLAKKFYIFSQFLYDEHIKSRLLKDWRYFKENHKESNQKNFPFERADKFNRGIRKLGLTANGLSYLDQFRLLISHIGNAMGYIRLIRSGGLHCCGNAIRFIPDLDDIVNFEEYCKEASLSTETQDISRNLDEVLSNLNKSFTEGTEYFRILGAVFSDEFQNIKNIHLKNFFIILPALTLNFIEHIINNKERLNRKNKTTTCFTDDGFAMGVAFILMLLNQNNKFDSLHWFQSVKEKYKQEKLPILQTIKMQNETKQDEKLLQTMSLTLKRIESYQQEFDLLYYSLSSARIFFRNEKKLQKDNS